VASVAFSDRQVCGSAFMRDFVAACRKMAPLVEFTTKALRLQGRTQQGPAGAGCKGREAVEAITSTGAALVAEPRILSNGVCEV